jgi:beta-lactamase class A
MLIMLTGPRFSRLIATIAAPLLLAACVSAPPVAKPGPVIIKPAPPISKPTPAPPPPVSMPRSGTAPAELEPQIHELWRTFPGKTGVAILALDGGWTISKRGDELFPQQSVSKLWVAMAVLDKVDKGEIKLDQMVRIGRDDLTLFHQPIRARVLANGEIQESVQSLMEQSIVTSDCTANDSLLRLAGGPEAVRRFVAEKGLGQIRFGAGERLMQSEIAGLTWQQSYSLGNNFWTARDALPFATRQAALNRYLANPSDGASPEAMVRALGRLSKGELLSSASTRLLLGMMERVTSGPNRLRAGVPMGWRFGHKTGTGQVLGSISTGYNDVGIMIAPDGRRYAVAVMMADTTATVPQRMVMMQGVSGAVAASHR